MFVFLLFPRPPGISLFPSTTLFRSLHDLVIAQPPWLLGNLILHELVLKDFSRVFEHQLEEDEIDRKSTRLNSSHLGISYAVLCLKKKIQRRHPRGPSDRQ